jgi:hypothetical protein
VPARIKFEFDFVTTATPEQVIELPTDFSPNRPAPLACVIDHVLG